MIASNEKSNNTKETRRGLTEVVGIDFGSSGTKVVRMKRSKDGLVVTGVCTLPALDVEEGMAQGTSKLDLPKSVRCRNVAVGYTGVNAVVRLLSMQNFSRQAPNANETIRDQVGMEQGYRMGYTVASPASRGKSETNLIVVGVPGDESGNLLEVVNSSGINAVSMEIAGLSSMTGFVQGPGGVSTKGAVGLIEAGERVTMLTVVEKGAPVLLRKFEFGHEQILEKVARQFTVDRETAEEILRQQSFDVSQPVGEATSAFLRQLAISKEFVERKVGSPVTDWYLSGGLASAPYWQDAVAKTIGQPPTVWNPLSNLYVGQDVWPKQLAGQESRFSAAVGLALGALEDL